MENGGTEPQTVTLERAGKQPAINAPWIVLALVAVFVAVHALLLAMPGDLSEWLMLAAAFSPARLTPPAEFANAVFPGGAGADVWTFVSYMFLHGDWLHLIVNSVWMLAFGSVVARWMGALRFIVFSLVCAIGAAVASQLVYWGTLSFMVGASGAVSGHMGGAVRLMFAMPGRIQLSHLGHEPTPAMPLARVLANGRARMFIFVWMAVNLVFGVIGFGNAADVGRIAWEAHIGGFVTGLVLFGLFTPKAVQ